MTSVDTTVADEKGYNAGSSPVDTADNTQPTIAGAATAVKKGNWSQIWVVIACGFALCSDGYLNSVIGSVNTCLSKLYGTEYSNSPAQKNVTSIVFVGTIVGQLSFGWVSDRFGRKVGMVLATIIVIVFSILSAGAWGAGGTVSGLLAALTAYRFFLGIGIGAEYPAGSVAASEATQDVKPGHRHMLFVLVTNVVIDFGFVLGAFVPLVLLWITTNLTVVWRVSLGLGAIPPMSVFYARIKMKETKGYAKNSMRHVKTPYWLVIKYYWVRLAAISVIWFVYDFSSYSFSIYASTILGYIIPNGTLYQVFGWNTVINLFYMPGALLGAWVTDYIGPKYCLALFVFLQAITGFIMSGLYLQLSGQVAAFAVVYGLFLSFGEAGPGDNIGLIAAKSFSSSVRGRCYGICSAVGKLGAFTGAYAFSSIIEAFGGADTAKGNSGPFFIGSGLAIISGILALLFVRRLDQDCIIEEDIKFREYLTSQGFDVSTLGLKNVDTEEQVVQVPSSIANKPSAWRRFNKMIGVSDAV